MSLDESNDVIGHSHHKEARNGVFKGNAPEMAFTAIRGNKKITNANLQTSGCRLAGNAVYIPDCSLAGNAQIYTPNCNLVGTSTWRHCELNGGAVLISLLPVWTLQPITTCISCVNTDVYKDTNPDSPTYLHYRVNGIDIGLTAYCQTLADWVEQTTTVCISCVATPVYRDMTPCSTSYLKYKVNDVIVGLTAPTQLDCVTDPTYTSQHFNQCIDCVNYDVKKDTNACSVTYGHYFANGYDLGDVEPINLDCEFAPILVSQGYTTCSGCQDLTVYKDTNPCSTSYLQYKVGTVFVGTTAPANFTCNTAKNLVGQGYYVCFGCASYEVKKDTNPCSSTYNHYFVSGEDQGATAPTESTCDTTATFIYQSFKTCVSCTTYDVFKDTNACSATFGHYQVNGVDVGITMPTVGACVTTPTWTDQGYSTCYFCTNKQVYKDTNPCSASYGHYQVNGIDQGATAPTNALCNTSPILTSQLYSTCFSCTSYTVYKNTNPCSTTYNHYYVGGEDQGTTAPASGACDTTAAWTLQSFQTCVSCVNTAVYKDTNVCSATYNHYRVNGVDVGTTSPDPTGCYTGVTLTSQGYTTCSSCSNYTVYKNTNPCSSTYNHYYVNGSDVGTGMPTAGSCYTGRTDIDQGYTTCIGCTNYTVYKNINPCSTSYNHYFANNTDLGTSAPSSAACNTSANWTVVFGTYTCSSCNKYAVEKDLNPCSSTYNQTRQGGIVESNSTYCYISGTNCCGQSTAAVWTNTGAYECISCVSYVQQRDTNVCSSSYNTTRAVVPGGSACNTTPNWVDSNPAYCGGDLCLYQHQIQTNPCAAGSVRDIQVGSCPSSSCSVQYALYRCDGTGTSYSYNLAIGTFSIGQIVVDGSGNYYSVSSAGAPGSGGTAVSASGLSSCPALYTLFSGCFGSYYIAGISSSYSGKGYSTSGSASGDCLTVTGVSTSPSGTEVFDWYSDPYCACV
jgi:hypothetical protein